MLIKNCILYKEVDPLQNKIKNNTDISIFSLITLKAAYIFSRFNIWIAYFQEQINDTALKKNKRRLNSDGNMLLKSMQ